MLRTWTFVNLGTLSAFCASLLLLGTPSKVAAEPSLLTPGQPELYRIDLGAIGHRFKPGHRVRVEISSSAAPFYNPNQNTGNPIATDTDWKTANQTVFHDDIRPSALLLPVYKGD